MEQLAEALEEGGAPAARTLPPSADEAVTIAHAATVATPRSDDALAPTQPNAGEATAVAVEIDAGEGADPAAVAEAQRRAVELAQRIAREHPASASGTGRRATVIAVAVVVLASLVLFVQLGDRPAERKAGDVAGARRDGDDRGGLKTGSGSASGTGTVVGTAEPPLALRDAGMTSMLPRPPDAARSVDELIDEAFVHLEAERFAEALARAEEVLRRDPDLPEARWIAAVAQCKQGRRDEAEAHARHFTDKTHLKDLAELCGWKK